MKLIQLNDVDSTSRYISKELNENKPKLPFAVCAKSQSAGRGRLGKSWESPEGNLYISFAFANNHIGASKMGWMPLKTGIIVADWLAETYGIAANLKWPNDVLFGTKKLAGILCESSVQGSEMGPLIIGVGLNLNIVPEMKDGSYQAESVGNLMGRQLGISQVAQSFADYLGDKWEEIRIEDVQHRFEEYVSSKDQIWLDTKSGDKYFFRGLQNDGSLRLEQIETRETIVCNSAHNQFGLLAQSPAANQGCYFADIGNTNTKLAQFDADDQLSMKEFNGSNPRGLIVYFGAVNEERRVRFLKECREFGFIAVEVKKRRIYSKDGGYQLAQMGIDRLAAVESFCQQNDSPGIVLSLGTCLTVDAIGVGAKHLGGWIVPGLQMSLDAMHQGTGALPAIAVEPELMQDSFGLNTQEAMAHGAYEVVLGLIERARGLCELHAGDDANVPVVCTGGNGALFAGVEGVAVDPGLILRGIRLMATGG